MERSTAFGVVLELSYEKPSVLEWCEVEKAIRKAEIQLMRVGIGSLNWAHNRIRYGS
jgi:hypothetical protein